MNTTDNEVQHGATPEEDAKLHHQNETGNTQELNGDSGKTQEQIDAEHRDALVKAEVSAPISESQVQPGREVVDGNGQRDTPEVEGTRPDIIVDEAADTQHAREVQAKETAKLNSNGQSRDKSSKDVK